MLLDWVVSLITAKSLHGMYSLMLFLAWRLTAQVIYPVILVEKLHGVFFSFPVFIGLESLTIYLVIFVRRRPLLRYNLTNILTNTQRWCCKGRIFTCFVQELTFVADLFRLRLQFLQVMLDNVTLSRFFFNFLTVRLQLITRLVFGLFVNKIVFIVVFLALLGLLNNVIGRDRAATPFACQTSACLFPLSLFFTFVGQFLTFLIFLAICAIRIIYRLLLVIQQTANVFANFWLNRFWNLPDMRCLLFYRHLC